jgi:ribosomal protein S18 acetylase RimI-like enzyme
MPGPAVRPVERRDIPQLSDTLARAFYTDPVLDWAMRTDAGRMGALREMFRHALESDLKYGEITTTEDLMACALWVPPEAMKAPHGPLEDLLMLPRLIGYSGLRRLPRIISFFKACEEKRPKTPHFYLDIIGVHPDRQGQGYASALLRHTLTRLDAQRQPAYLESSNPRNNPLYRRNGFEITDEIHLPDGPTLWCMWRDPAHAPPQSSATDTPKNPRKQP